MFYGGGTLLALGRSSDAGGWGDLQAQIQTIHDEIVTLRTRVSVLETALAGQTSEGVQDPEFSELVARVSVLEAHSMQALRYSRRTTGGDANVFSTRAGAEYTILSREDLAAKKYMFFVESVDSTPDFFRLNYSGSGLQFGYKVVQHDGFLNDFYTKSQVDAKLPGVASYTKAEVDALTAGLLTAVNAKPELIYDSGTKGIKIFDNSGKSFSLSLLGYPGGPVGPHVAVKSAAAAGTPGFSASLPNTSYISV